ncbi:MAG: ATP-binding cassette domain-containing protein [Leptospirillia bacterium]
MNDAIIHTEGLCRTFSEGRRSIEAVREVDLSVMRGEIFGFLGPNGAGKSTTINMLCTLLKPTGGRALVAGLDVVQKPHAVRQKIGLVFQDPSLDERLTAHENMVFHAMLYGVPRHIWKTRINDMLHMVSLDERANDLVRGFSGGMKRRLEIARGLLHRPDLLFLDEPTLGLDPQTRNLMWDYILKLRAEHGITLFLTTHYMEEAEHCDRIAIMDQGKIIALGTPDELKAGVGLDRVSIGTPNPAEAARHIGEKYDVEVEVNGGGLSFQVQDGAAFLPTLLSGSDMSVSRVEVHRPTLEDVFLSLTGKTIRDTAPDYFANLKSSARRAR